MTHIAYQKKGRQVTLDTDYVVVGSGPGGATTALELTKGGAKVVLVEAGAWRQPKDYPGSCYGSMRDFLQYSGMIMAQGNATLPIAKGSCVGGSTTINSAICVRTPEDIFELWKNEHGIKENKIMEKVLGHQEQLEVELHASETPYDVIGKSSQLFLKGMKQCNADAHILKRYVKNCRGTAQCFEGCKVGAKQSLNITFVPQMQALGGTILSCAPVEKVILSNNKAIGVFGHFRHPQTKKQGGRFSVNASKGVVVSASATDSPVLLMKSGVQSKALGKRFMAHPGGTVIGIYDEYVDMHRGATQGAGSLAFRKSHGIKYESLSLDFEIGLGRIAGGGRELMKRLSQYRHMSFWTCPIQASAEGTVKPGIFGSPPIVKYHLTKKDMLTMRQAFYQLAKTHVMAGAKSIITCINGLPNELLPNEIDQLKYTTLNPKDYGIALTHLFGGCVMGGDPNKSVCDEYGQVHGYKNLFVSDASILPTTLGVNPQHTIMGMARYLSEYWLNR